jgi:hypothetical protein
MPDERADLDATAGEALADEQPEPTLPEPVRQRVIALAAAAMTGMPADELPARCAGGAVRPEPAGPAGRRRHRRPARRGSAVPAAARHRVVDGAGELGAAVRDGAPPAAADPVEVAALAYLARPAAGGAGRRAPRPAARREQRRGRRPAGRGRAPGHAGRARARRGQGRGGQAARRADPAAGRGGHAAGRGAHAHPSVREAQRRERKAADMLATEKGRAARRRRHGGRAAPAARQAGRRRGPSPRGPGSPPRRAAPWTRPGCGCCWRRSGRRPSG